jgi:integrase
MPMLCKSVPIEMLPKTLGHADIAITHRVYQYVLESEKQQFVIDLFPNHVKP